MKLLAKIQALEIRSHNLLHQVRTLNCKLWTQVHRGWGAMSLSLLLSQSHLFVFVCSETSDQSLDEDGPPLVSRRKQN